MKDFLSRTRKTFFFFLPQGAFPPQSQSTAATTTSSASKVASLNKSRDTVAVSRHDACWLLFRLEREVVGGNQNSISTKVSPHYYSVTLPQCIRTRLRGGATSSTVPPIGDSEPSAAFRPVPQRTQGGGDEEEGKRRRNWEGEKKSDYSSVVKLFQSRSPPTPDAPHTPPPWAVRRRGSLLKLKARQTLKICFCFQVLIMFLQRRRRTRREKKSFPAACV